MADSDDSKVLDVAAVDLGSNSFHMIVARTQGSDIKVLDRMRESVRLAEGLDESRRLSVDVQDRAIACLQRFGERLKGIPPHQVRVVGTNTLRRLRGSKPFLAAAEAALGHSVEVISGVEEARLVHGAVVHGKPDDDTRRLIVDIGGGSTELIIGKGHKPRLMQSVSLGCVVHTGLYFPDGKITRKAFNAARLAARVELEYLERAYRRAGWEVAIGTSGSIRGIWRVIVEQGWGTEEISRESLERVIELVIGLGSIKKIRFDALRDDRRPVFVGGLAVLAGVFDSLRIERMETSEMALREGLVHDLLGRLSNDDVRDQSVGAMAERYSLDAGQARAVAESAAALLKQAAAPWRLPMPDSGQWLAWAATLHEVGLAISHSSYHKHGEYILRNADLSGFSRTDQQRVAALVRLHRGKFQGEVLDGLPPEDQESMRYLAVLLRLAFLMRRSRNDEAVAMPVLSVNGRRLALKFESGWLDDHALTAGDLEREVRQLRRAGFRLSYK